MSNDKKWILLNVGGTELMTSRATLRKSTPTTSPLHRISNNSTNIDFDRDETGAYIIDRDPIYFRPLLNFLRHGHLILDANVAEEGVLLEAEYFNLPELIKVIKQRINDRTFPLNQTRPSSTTTATNHHQVAPMKPFINQQDYLTGYGMMNKMLADDVNHPMRKMHQNLY